MVVFERLHYLQAREAIRDVHGLDSSMDWIGLGPMTVMYKIMTSRGNMPDQTSRLLGVQ